MLRCFGAKIYAINRTGRTDESVDYVGTLKDLEHVLRVADVVVIALPLTKSTRKLIGTKEFSWMKSNAIFVNVARGDIVDEAALYVKLKANPEFMAGIDTWWIEPFRHGKFQTNHPFLDLPNFLGSPHNSGIVPGAFTVASRRAAENVKRFLNGQPIVGAVEEEDKS